MNEYLTAQDISKVTKLSPRHISERLSKQDATFPKPYRFGNSKRWERSEFEAWVKMKKEA